MGRNERLFSKNTEAVSEVIGEILLTAIAVLMFSIITVFIFSYATPDERVYADVDGWVNVDSDTIVLRHAGGERIDTEKIRILIDLNGIRQELDPADILSITGSNVWQLGEMIVINTSTLWNTTINENDSIAAAIIHKDANMIIKSGTLLGREDRTGTGNTSGNVTPPQPPGAVAPNDQVAWWKLNENTGTLASDSVNNYDADISGASWTTGVNGSALLFDGTDYVQYDQKIVSDYPFTISAWVKTTDTSEQAIVNLARSDKNDRYFGIYIDDSGRAALVAKNRGSESTITGAIVNDGEWYHISGVFSSDNERNLYVNGAHNGTDSNNVDFPNNANNVWSFGMWGDKTPSAYFDGTIDEVKLWDRALNTTEVQQLYLNP
jgi:FlaG/FlaF family flagellin (archaellin)